MATTPSSEHVFEILRLVCRSPEPMGVAEVARQLSLAASTAHRALSSLEEPGFLTRVRNTSKVQPGPMATRVAQALFRRFPVFGPALAAVRDCVAMTRETASFSVRLGWYTLRIVAVPGTRELYHARNLGQVQLLHEGLAGRAILGTLPPSQLDRYEGFLKRNHLVGSTVSVRNEIRALLSGARDDGAVFSVFPPNEEFVSVALPVAGAGSKAVGALVVEGAVVALGSKSGERRLKELVRRARQLDELLQENAALTVNPFEHLDADEIRLDHSVRATSGDQRL